MTNRTVPPSDQQLSVCYFVNGFPQPSETFIADEAHALRQRGARVLIVHLYPGSFSVVHPSSAALLAEGLVKRVSEITMGGLLRGWTSLAMTRPLRTISATVRAVFSKNLRSLIKAIPTAAWCASERIGFLHAHFADANWAFAHAVAHWTGLPLGVTTHRYDLLDAPIGIEPAARLFQQTQLVVTISEWNRRYLFEHFGVPLERTRVVHCGVDVGEFSLVERTQAHADAPLRLLNVARLVPVKGQAILLRALARARESMANLTLEIIGGGPLEAELRDLSKQLGLDSVVIFHGEQPRQIVLERLRCADLFVLPSLSEGIPVACMEAMSTGAVVIATNVNGLPELIEDGVTGRLVNPSDEESLAEALIWAHENREGLPGMGLAAREWIVRHFNRETSTIYLSDLIARSTKFRK